MGASSSSSQEKVKCFGQMFRENVMLITLSPSPDSDAGALSMEPLYLHHPWLKHLPLLLGEASAYANHFKSLDNNDDIDHT